MTLDREQRAILLWSLAAIAVAAIVLYGGYLWLPPERVGAGGAMTIADQLAFTLKWQLPVFLWLAGCVRQVASGRFRFREDRPGAAFAKPSPAIAVRAAVLQNSLEQTVLIAGTTLIVATLLRGPELVLIPLMIVLFLAGRIAFSDTYAKGAAARAFGMALTAAPIIAAIGIAFGLLIAGR